MNTYGISRQPGLALAMCCAPLSLDRCNTLPPPEMMGQPVMIAALGKVIGCARFTGIVTLGEPDAASRGSATGLEHRSAAGIRRSLSGRVDMFGPLLWVFEDGVVFERAVKIDAGRSDAAWPVPAELRQPLDEARRWAMGTDDDDGQSTPAPPLRVVSRI